MLAKRKSAWIAAEAAHQDVGATLLLQVFGGADGQVSLAQTMAWVVG